MNRFKMVVDGFVFMNEKAAQKAHQEVDGIQYVKDRLDMGNPRMVLQMYRKLLAEQVFETPVGWVYLKELQNYLLAAPELEGEDIEAIVLPVKSVSLAVQQTAAQSTQQTAQPVTVQDTPQAAQPAASKGAQQAALQQPGERRTLTPQAAARQQETLEWYVEKLEESRQQERLAEYRRRRAEERTKESRKHLRFSLLFAFFMVLVTVGVGAVTLTDQHPNIINYESKIIQKYQDWEADLENREQILKEKELEQMPQ